MLKYRYLLFLALSGSFAPHHKTIKAMGYEPAKLAILRKEREKIKLREQQRQENEQKKQELIEQRRLAKEREAKRQELLAELAAAKGKPQENILNGITKSLSLLKSKLVDLINSLDFYTKPASSLLDIHDNPTLSDDLEDIPEDILSPELQKSPEEIEKEEVQKFLQSFYSSKKLNQKAFEQAAKQNISEILTVLNKLPTLEKATYLPIKKFIATTNLVDLDNLVWIRDKFLGKIVSSDQFKLTDAKQKLYWKIIINNLMRSFVQRIIAKIDRIEVDQSTIQDIENYFLQLIALFKGANEQIPGNLEEEKNSLVEQVDQKIEMMKTIRDTSQAINDTFITMQSYIEKFEAPDEMSDELRNFINSLKENMYSQPKELLIVSLQALQKQAVSNQRDLDTLTTISQLIDDNNLVEAKKQLERMGPRYFRFIDNIEVKAKINASREISSINKVEQTIELLKRIDSLQLSDEQKATITTYIEQLEPLINEKDDFDRINKFNVLLAKLIETIEQFNITIQPESTEIAESLLEPTSILKNILIKADSLEINKKSTTYEDILEKLSDLTERTSNLAENNPVIQPLIEGVFVPLATNMISKILQDIKNFQYKGAELIANALLPAISKISHLSPELKVLEAQKEFIGDSFKALASTQDVTQVVKDAGSSSKATMKELVEKLKVIDNPENLTIKELAEESKLLESINSKLVSTVTRMVNTLTKNNENIEEIKVTGESGRQYKIFKEKLDEVLNALNIKGVGFEIKMYEQTDEDVQLTQSFQNIASALEPFKTNTRVNSLINLIDRYNISDFKNAAQVLPEDKRKEIIQELQSLNVMQQASDDISTLLLGNIIQLEQAIK